MTDTSDFCSQLYVSNVTSLLSVVGRLMSTSVTLRPADYPKDLLSEWVELHALSIYGVILPYFVSMAGEF